MIFIFISATVLSDLDDNQKTWLIVGICLHNIISPVLRDYVKPEVTKLFAALKNAHKIDNQTYPNILEKHPQPNGYMLNYQSINNNSQHGKNRQRFDYAVKTEIDLSKLFLPTHMAHYTGINDTCDASALLGLLLNMGTFPPLLTTVAGKVSLS